jgi:hypothetical protein
MGLNHSFRGMHGVPQEGSNRKHAQDPLGVGQSRFKLNALTRCPDSV